MQTHPYGSEREYTDCMTQLADLSSGFIEDLKKKDIKPTSTAHKGRVQDAIGLISAAELSFVADLETPLVTFNNELTTMTRKFQVLKSTYTKPVSFQDFIKNYKANPAGAYRGLIKSIDASLEQINSVITAYSSIERQKGPAKRWILTILSHHSTEKAMGKARRSSEILKKVETIIEDARGTCHGTKLGLLNIREVAQRYAAQESGTGQAGVEQAKEKETYIPRY